MLEEILLDDPARSKLGIYKEILSIENGDYPIHYFEKKTGYSHIKTANLLNGMRADLLDFSPESQLMNERDKVRANDGLPSYQRYQQYLFSKSIPYQVLLESLFHPERDLKDFGEISGLSQSSLMRRLKPLVEYLRTKDIRLNCLQMEITGRESFIRLMYFNFMWMVNFGTEIMEYFQNELHLPLDRLMSEKDQEFLKFVEKREFNVHQGISFLRSRKEQYVDEPRINRFTYPPAVNRPFKNALEKQGVPETYQERESNFIAYLIFYWPQYFTVSDPRLSWVKKNYVKQNESREYAERFYQKIRRKVFLPSEAKKELFLINLQTAFLRGELFEGKIPMNLNFVLDSIKEQHPKYEEIEKKVSNVLGKIPNKSFILPILTLVTMNHYEKHQIPKKISVGIIGFPNHFLLYALIDRIEKLPFVHYSLMNTGSDKQYDVILTCSSKLLPEATRDYWVIEGESSFEKMDDYLFNLFKQKIHQD